MIRADTCWENSIHVAGKVNKFVGVGKEGAKH